MNKTSRILTLLLLIGAALLLGACSGRAFAASSWPGLLVDSTRNTVFLSYNTGVYALDLDNGNMRWRFPSETDDQINFFARPSLTENGQLVVGGFDNTLYSIDPDNGQRLWEFDGAGGRFIGGALPLNGRIYATNADGTLYALTDEGQLDWEFETDEAIWSQPATDGELVYLASMDHNVYALDPASGAVRWEQNIGGAAVGTPTLHEENELYVGTFANELLALETSSGEIRWRAPTDGWVWSGPTLWEDRLYFGDLQGMLYALDRASGSQIWKIPLDGPVAGSPLAIEENIFVTSENGDLVAVSHDGGILWTRELGGKIYTHPVQTEDAILVAPIDGEDLLIAVDRNGNQRWAFTPEE